MFINSQIYDRRLSDSAPKFVIKLEQSQTGLTTFFTPRVIPKDEYVKSLEDSVFYDLENQLQNGIPLSPVNTNFVQPSDIDMTEIVTDKFDSLRQSDVLSFEGSINQTSTSQPDTTTNN